ncbi:MAG: UbiA family prenyltransferase [Promethearchaeota archaeon]
MEKNKIIGAIKAIRPQFIFAYFVVAFGGLIIGLAQGLSINYSLAIFSSLAIGFAVAGINCRDEAYDWVEGYDLEHGGMGVIRDGTFEAKTLKRWGIGLNLVAVVFFLIQILIFPLLLILFIPGLVIIIGSNYLTEKIFLGHELITALSFWAVLIWMYLGQGWILTIPTILFSIFAYLLVLSFVAYQDIGDYEADKKSGKKTLTVKLGLDRVGILSIFIGLMAIIVLYIAIFSLTL